MRHYTYIVLVCALLAMPAEAQVASIVQSTTVAQVPPGTESENGCHVVVRINDWAYDAYTGPTGLPWRQYISRLEAQTKLIEKAVEVISE